MGALPLHKSHLACRNGRASFGAAQLPRISQGANAQRMHEGGQKTVGAELAIGAHWAWHQRGSSTPRDGGEPSQLLRRVEWGLPSQRSASLVRNSSAGFAKKKTGRLF
jgi:hypothetical protein